MGTVATRGVVVSAKARFEPAHSDPKAARFIFSYRITIANRGKEAVQLLRRHWIIRDSLAALRQVEGPGVVGESPVIQPGEEYSYSSACDLRSGFGRMEGTYLMRYVEGGQVFRAAIPVMQLLTPISAN